MTSASPSPTAASWDDARFLKRTMMSLKELLQFNVGAKRRSLYAYNYCGEICPSASQAAAAQQQSAPTVSVTQLLRSPSFQLPEPSVSFSPSRVWCCEQGDDCSYSHSPIEAAFHFDNYKRVACPVARHLQCYPLHIQQEMSVSPQEREMLNDDFEGLQRCPFYHSLAERDAWECWRGSYLGFSPSDAEDSTYGQELLAITPTFVKMRAAIDSLTSKAAAEVGRVARGEVGALALGPVDVLALANEMEEGCTHRVLCFMMFAEYAVPDLIIAWPRSNVSAALTIQQEYIWTSSNLLPLKERYAAQCIVVDPLSNDVERFVTVDHLCAVAEWLLAAGKLIGSDAFVVLKFFPHCTSAPFAHSVPHRYYSYVAFVAAALTSSQRRGDMELKPLSFLLQISAAVLLGISHWIIERGWVRRRSIETTTVEAYLEAHPPSPA